MSGPTVFVVDDDEAYRDSVLELLASVGLRGECFASADGFLEAFDPARAGCLVLDVRMARMSGLALQERLNAIGATLPIVFVSGHGDVPTAVSALKGGAVDFVQKPCREQQLLDAINEALRRDAMRRSPPPAAPATRLSLEALSGREREVLAHALQGLSSKQIARQLSLSHRTVEHHRSRLLEKLGVSSVVELMRLNAGPLLPIADADPDRRPSPPR
jgi:two-component system response regulator DctR